MGGAVSNGRLRWPLLASASALALGMIDTRSAQACSSLSSDVTLSGSTSCVQWTGGDFSIASTGVISSGSPSLYVSVTGNTLVNSGRIIGSEVGIENVALSTIAVLNNTSTGTITASYTAAIQNYGSIGSLTNSGQITISNSYPAILNYGTIGGLTNNATIAGRYGIYNSSGSIGSIANSGAISASRTGIYNAATLTSLTNQGSITGSINAISNNGGNISSLINDSGGFITGLGSGSSGVKNSGNIIALTNNSGGSISGGSYAIYNSGNIGSLTNGGAIISSGNNGIYSSGSIGSLANSGTITGSTGLYNAGSIAGLTNTGTIIGTSYALFNLGPGSIGPINNSGLIAGNIENTSVNSLTINGGSGSTFGTLTGASGGIGSADRGTITSTASNLVFSSGNILLNDNINATGFSVINSGATLRLDNAISVTGNYTQTAGGLLITATGSGTSYGYLSVSGNAVVSNSTVTISGAGLTAGQTFTIVRAGGTGSYTNDTATVGVTNGLGATVSTVGSNLVVTLASGNSANTYTSKGAAAGGTGVPLGITLDQIQQGTSPQNVNFQTNVLTLLDALPTGSQGNAIKQLGPNQNPPNRQMSFSANNTLLGAVEQHQQGMFGGNGVGAGSESYGSALWGQFLGGGARQETTAAADGYRLRDFGFTAGVDHQFTPSLLTGVALSWIRVNANGLDNSAGSSSTLDNYQLTLYGTYRRGAAYVDAQFGGGVNRINQQRRIDFLGVTASSKFDGVQYVVKATGGYDIQARGFIVTPFASLQWLQATTDAYTETGAGAANLSVNRNTSDSVTQDLGAKVATSFKTRLGTFTPEARLSWVHDYTNGPIITSGLMGGQTFAVNAPRSSADGARIGLAATLSGDAAWSLRAQYEGQLRSGYQSHTGLLKASWGF